ncbi:putative Rho GTPase activator [Talaromyces proteolyticus]|uniref:Rho GTPase activator n=1 Tax=Talaromyces proteolyticus TaxID=1131652 RepID=A0AAD4PXN7_9EURO|nr:putative Rho GTPase activator [Talaromyces proteolyticus]KAH8693519.1 putative Rho GTPase activator [Talaromyces proteolyticus]
MTEGNTNGGRGRMAESIEPIANNASPTQTPPSGFDKAGSRNLPRTSSIDSAISSISSASHSQKASFDSNTLTSADINNIITAAGSAEAVILHLIKDRHHVVARNEQLWRLLEKQRALVLGLNKDLERAVKDKEKYRKKLKELQAQIPSLSITDQQSTTGPFSIKDNFSGAQTSNPSAFGNNSRQHNQGTPVLTHIDAQISSVSQDLEKESTPSPLPSLHSQDIRAQANTSNEPRAEHMRNTGKVNIDAGPIVELPKLPPPNRKPPPAPLNLNQIHRRSSPVDPTTYPDSGSEYDDSDRGRRRTREEDDEEREAAVVREQEARSMSKKKARPEVAVVEPNHTSFPSAPKGVPSSPRKVVTSSPHKGNGQFAATDSLAAIINSNLSDRVSLDERVGMTSSIPGLPVSPRPGDRPLGSPLPRMPREGSGVIVSPPVSPRSTVPGLPQSPRATKSPAIPVQQKLTQLPSIDASVKINSPGANYSYDRSIYQGLVSDDYPGLLLPPNALPSIEIKVASSRLRPSRTSYVGGRPNDEEQVFILSIFSRFSRSELWRVEKAILALPQLDQQIRHGCDFKGKLPDRSIFSGHSPAKVDARRDALNSYFETLLDTPMAEPVALVICRFLSSDAIEPRDDETNLLTANGKSTPELVRGPDGKSRKEGYLTKRGKNFGGWKSRYFVLHGPELKYFESPGGAHLGTIKLLNAQIGKQSQGNQNQSPSRNEDDNDNQYRHAFLILEPKKKDSSALVRHVLCAESDEERDIWVDALLQYVESASSDDEKFISASAKPHSATKPPAVSNPKSRLFNNNNGKGSKGSNSPDTEIPPDTVQGFSFDNAVAAEPPVFGTTYEKEGSRASPALGDSANSDSMHAGIQSSKVISGPTNGAIIQDVGAWGNKPATSTKEKKRSIWGFRARSSSDLAVQQAENNSNGASTERKEFVRPVFGMPLAEAMQFCGPRNVEDAELPAVVYRCIEYLQAKGAASEEGIFRLSGSNVVVKALKERFNTEGDVDFLADDTYYDVHAVASLFKQYLRELPTTVLTLELQYEFRRVPELEEKEHKIAALNVLVHMLPRPNLVLLSALSQFLIQIVENSDVNKMTLRNVGIVFAPTLNMPAPVFSLFLTEYDSIFGELSEPIKTSGLEVKAPALEDVRSPRHQVFPGTGISTPSYGQTSFFVSDDVDTQSSQDFIKSKYDTGFVPMVQTYDKPRPVPDPRPRQQDNLHHMTRMLDPNETSRSAKAQRRESSMLFMDLGQRKSSLPYMGDDQSSSTYRSSFE